MRGAALFLTLCTCVGMAHGQEGDSLFARLSVLSEPPGAELYVDSVLAGRTPAEELRLRPGQHLLELRYPSVGAWNALELTDSVVLFSGQSVDRSYVLGTYIRLTTVPPGAVVVAKDSALGVTPTAFRSDQRREAVVVLRKTGYRDTTLTLHPTDRQLRLVLTPVGQTGILSRSQVDHPLVPPDSKSPWVAYAAAASAVSFGVAAAYFNHQANRNFDLYTSSGNSDYLDATKKYDRAAFWTLIVTEVSFGVLAYLLLSE